MFVPRVRIELTTPASSEALDLLRHNPFYCNFQILTAKNSDLVEIASSYSSSIFILFA